MAALPVFLFLSLFLRQSLCQQSYVGNETNCSNNTTSTPKGYVCIDSIYSCSSSYLTFRSKPPYDTQSTISDLFAGYVYKTTLNNGSLFATSISCSCVRRSYRTISYYTIKRGDSYEKIAYDIYQGLVSCSALKSQNQQDYAVDNTSSIDMILQVPLRCACPTKAQEANGVKALYVYMLQPDESIGSVARDFGVEEHSVLEANKLSNTSRIYPFTPILVPLNQTDICRIHPDSYNPYCRNSPSSDLAQQLPSIFIYYVSIPIGLSLCGV